MSNLSTLAVVILIITYCAAYYMSAQVIDITITDKERVMSADGSSSKYLVFTDSSVYQNTDSYLFMKFTSSDLQGKLHIDSTYTVKVAGWRIPFLSAHRNIIAITV